MRFNAPQGPGVRVDSGYEVGSLVPNVFDSMLAKVITRGANRREALARMETALRDTIIVLDSGLTNRSLLLELVSGTAFRDGPVTTRWLDAHLAGRASPPQRAHLDVALAAAALGDYLRLRRGQVANFLDEAQRGLPRTVPDAGPTTIRYLLDRRPLQVDVATLGPEELLLRCGDWEGIVRGHGTGERTLIVELGGHRYSIQRVATATEVHVEVEGVAHHFGRLSDGLVRAALPASVAQVHVQPGERVTAGSRLVTLEAMKMETVVESPLSGTVRAVHARPASQVAAGEVMVEIEESRGDAPAADIAPALPRRREPPLDPLRILEACLLGFDVTAEEVEAARDALERDAHPSRSRLLLLLRAAVVQEQLFKTGPYDDARNEAKESSLDQLAWFVHHRHLDEERLSARFARRMQRFLELHGIRDVDRDPQVGNALLRLFQSRRVEDGASVLVLSVLHALARSTAGRGGAGAIGRATRDLREAGQRGRPARRPPGGHGGMEPDLPLVRPTGPAGRGQAAGGARPLRCSTSSWARRPRLHARTSGAPSLACRSRRSSRRSPVSRGSASRSWPCGCCSSGSTNGATTTTCRRCWDGCRASACGRRATGRCSVSS